MKTTTIFALLVLVACTQANPDQYKATGPQPVAGESNGVFYDATNDRLSLFVNDAEVAYVTSAGNIVPDGTITSTGVFAASSTSTFTGDATFSGGAGAVTFSDSASSIVLPDADATALLIGSTGMLGLVTIDTSDNLEEVNIVGTTATSAFRVDTGFATFDEQAVLTLGADVNGDLLCGGGAGAITFDAQGSILMTGTADNAAAGLSIGSTGDTDIMTIDTEDAGPGVTVNGTFNVLDAGSAGWTAAAAGDTACNTTCAGTGACLFGYDIATTAVVACDNAAADSCICGGPAA